jgi:diacylglycerol kinase
MIGLERIFKFSSAAFFRSLAQEAELEQELTLLWLLIDLDFYLLLLDLKNLFFLGLVIDLNKTFFLTMLL